MKSTAIISLAIVSAAAPAIAAPALFSPQADWKRHDLTSDADSLVDSVVQDGLIPANVGEAILNLVNDTTPDLELLLDGLLVLDPDNSTTTTNSTLPSKRDWGEIFDLTAQEIKSILDGSINNNNSKRSVTSAIKNAFNKIGVTIKGTFKNVAKRELSDNPADALARRSAIGDFVSKLLDEYGPHLVGRAGTEQDIDKYVAEVVGELKSLLPSSTPTSKKVAQRELSGDPADALARRNEIDDLVTELLDKYGPHLVGRAATEQDVDKYVDEVVRKLKSLLPTSTPTSQKRHIITTLHNDGNAHEKYYHPSNSAKRSVTLEDDPVNGFPDHEPLEERSPISVDPEDVEYYLYKAYNFYNQHVAGGSSSDQNTKRSPLSVDPEDVEYYLYKAYNFYNQHIGGSNSGQNTKRSPLSVDPEDVEYYLYKAYNFYNQHIAGSSSSDSNSKRSVGSENKSLAEKHEHALLNPKHSERQFVHPVSYIPHLPNEDGKAREPTALPSFEERDLNAEFDSLLDKVKSPLPNSSGMSRRSVVDEFTTLVQQLKEELGSAREVSSSSTATKRSTDSASGAGALSHDDVKNIWTQLNARDMELD
ncbi:hypothetical protein HYDPIDRAFT_168409 [Hydnomerulius pinastri MD-312]|uniref:Uncharacterized protein n=1 Tax=Hydnomerulius pinastri MD-312 TaxID=994086 RepID=A0A0C9WER7_9AGAM|nr:hypothetical protein HYDPIDRAFT_168409 [Hydnomerulius pinastri MD-312]